jgi:hypothetical protein
MPILVELAILPQQRTEPKDPRNILSFTSPSLQYATTAGWAPSSKISDDNFPHWYPLPSLDLSSSRSNLSRARSPEHANESAGFCSGDPFLVHRNSTLVSMLFIFGIMQILVAYDIATSLSLLSCCDSGVRSRSSVTLI